MNKEQTLTEKYRPKTFEDMVGNKQGIKVFKKLATSNRRSFIVYGITGSGKTTLARIIARELDAELVEMNIGSDSGVDIVRTMIAESPYSFGNNVVYILDEVHALTNSAKGALLKLVEEPPANSYFFLITTDVDKLYSGSNGQALKTRLTPIKTETLDTKTIYNYLLSIIQKENKGGIVPDGVIGEIARLAEGSMRQAMRYLEAVIVFEDSADMYSYLDSVQLGENSPEIIDICRAVYGGSWDKAKGLLAKVKNSIDMENLRRVLMGYGTSILLNKGNRALAEAIFLLNTMPIPANYGGLCAVCFLIVQKMRG